jgi:hypothetical protein
MKRSLGDYHSIGQVQFCLDAASLDKALNIPRLAIGEATIARALVMSGRE